MATSKLNQINVIMTQGYHYTIYMEALYVIWRPCAKRYSVFPLGYLTFSKTVLL